MSVHINLELTDHCNIKCPMCSQSLRDEAHGAPKRFMSWEVWQASLASLEDMEEDVHLCPHWLSEPTIHPEFDRFVRYAFEQNTDRRLFHEFKLHTNAVIFSEERARMLVELANAPGAHPDCFRFIHFSIDSFSKKSYVLCKGADRRDQVFENVERFLRARKLDVDKAEAMVVACVAFRRAHRVALGARLQSRRLLLRQRLSRQPFVLTERLPRLQVTEPVREFCRRLHVGEQDEVNGR